MLAAAVLFVVGLVAWCAIGVVLARGERPEELASDAKRPGSCAAQPCPRFPASALRNPAETGGRAG